MTERPPAPADRRYPLEPLANAMGLTVAAACRQLGLSGTTQKTARTEGVTEAVADRLAGRAGLDPYGIWPEMVDHLVADAHRTCAADDCTQTFIPYRPNHRYCSTSCSRRIAARRRRATNGPAVRTYHRTWRQQNADHYRTYNREYQRRYMRRVRARQRTQAARTEGAA